MGQQRVLAAKPGVPSAGRTSVPVERVLQLALAARPCPSFGRDGARCPTIAQGGFGWAVAGGYPCAQPQAALAFLLSSWLRGSVPGPVDVRPGVVGTCATADVSQGAHSFRELLAGCFGFFLCFFFLFFLP